MIFMTILQAQGHAGTYLPGYENYRDLFRAVGETVHQSCLLVTSREKPAEIAMLEGEGSPVSSLKLVGSPEAAIALIQAKGLTGSQEEQQELCRRYSCNALALKIVATSIQDLFGGDIKEFLAEDTILFYNVRRLLEEQFNRLSSLEQSVMYWLAINREWTTISELTADMIPKVSKLDLLGALESLMWRSLLEKREGKYTQQPVVMEYVTERLIKGAIAEIGEANTPLNLLGNYALIKTNVKDYIRDSQYRLILDPIATKLGYAYPDKTLFALQIKTVLQEIKTQIPHTLNYAAGNLINLGSYLELDFQGFDFSNLIVRQAYLQGVSLQGVNFQNVEFSRSLFTQSLGSVLAIAYSPDNTRIAIADDEGVIYIWQVASHQLELTLRGHSDWVWSVDWSPDGRILGGSLDGTVRIWDLATGQCLRVLKHDNYVWSVAWSHNGKMLASASFDRTVKIWDTTTGLCIHTLLGHQNWLWSVAWSKCDRTLVTGGQDQMAKFWDVSTGKCLKTLQGYVGAIWTLAWSEDGQTLFSGSGDHALRQWQVTTGECLKATKGNREIVWAISPSPERKCFVSGGASKVVRIWDLETGQLLRTLSGHQGSIWRAHWSPDGQILASASNDCTVRLWSPTSGECLKTLTEHNYWVTSLAWRNDSQMLASGCINRTVKIWQTDTGKCVRTLTGHQDAVFGIDWSPDGKLIASASFDRTVKIWQTQMGECVKTFAGSDSIFYSVAWHPDGSTIAIGGGDKNVYIWDVETDKCLQVLQGHHNWIYCLAWSPDGLSSNGDNILASGGSDRTVRLWNVETGECLRVLIPDRPYEGTNISGVKSLTVAQASTLRSLGAYET